MRCARAGSRFPRTEPRTSGPPEVIPALVRRCHGPAFGGPVASRHVVRGISATFIRIEAVSGSRAGSSLGSPPPVREPCRSRHGSLTLVRRHAAICARALGRRPIIGADERRPRCLRGAAGPSPGRAAGDPGRLPRPGGAVPPGSVGTSSANARRMAELNAAYDKVRTVELRQAYDRQLRAGRRRHRLQRRDAPGRRGQALLRRTRRAGHWTSADTRD